MVLKKKNSFSFSFCICTAEGHLEGHLCAQGGKILEWTLPGHHLNTSPYRILPIFVFLMLLESVNTCFPLFLRSGWSARVGRSVCSRRRGSSSYAPPIFSQKLVFGRKILGAQLLETRLREPTLRPTQADLPEGRNN